MAGPCAVESREQLMETARCVKREGARVLRGGAFKPRTSPYSFQGLGLPALELLHQAHDEYGLPVISEIVDPTDVPAFDEHVDIIQVGARNMANFVLLKAVGQSKRPVLLKRGLSATIEEWLLAAEYILSAGNPNVILCERGIRTFETATRNTLDLSAVPVLRSRTHLPIIVDPSHGTGHRALVAPMALAGAAVGADGLIIEVHPDPANARPMATRASASTSSAPSWTSCAGSSSSDRPTPSRLPPPHRPSPPARSRTSATGSTTSTHALPRWSRSAPRSRSRFSAGASRPHTATTSAASARSWSEAATGTTGPMTPVELTMVFDALLRASRSVQRRHAHSATEADAAATGSGR